MKSVASILTLALAGLSAALPVLEEANDLQDRSTATALTTTSYVARFDLAKTTGLISGLPTRAVAPLGVFDNLFFDIGLISLANVVVGLKAQSPSNVLAFDAVSTTTQGQPQIYSKYSNSKTDHFTFQSFYFGCVITNALTVGSVATGCSVTATGYRNGKQVATESFTFKPTSSLLGISLSSKMTKATLNTNFANVDQVIFSANGLVASTLEAVLIDDVAFKAYLKK